MTELFHENMCMMVDTVYLSPNGTIRGVLAVEHQLRSLDFTYKMLRKMNYLNAQIITTETLKQIQKQEGLSLNK